MDSPTVAQQFYTLLARSLSTSLIASFDRTAGSPVVCINHQKQIYAANLTYLELSLPTSTSIEIGPLRRGQTNTLERVFIYFISI